ncbi:MAG TPA: hypothetical protein VJ352_05655 [Geodermatophilus sp.]|nr:hypothetical protein [Geodermatophilus sp.]
MLIGAGAALTLDDFAWWLHLADLYWSREGLSSWTRCGSRWWSG